MNFYSLIPLIFLKFWFFDAPLAIIGFFRSLNRSFNEAFSFSLFAKTLFKPLKNEYREGLVGFSIAMGVIVKSVMIIVDTVIFTAMLIFELMVILGFILFPIATGALLFL